MSLMRSRAMSAKNLLQKYEVRAQFKYYIERTGTIKMNSN
ncbi:hypothetical protein CKA32_002292 [Geitlerinema sp. FC II]|nr:hypothetical protein CKA32_002292 [Geitlerinema sp. FC II]